MDSVTFELADPYTALRLMVGGEEISIDSGGTFKTSDPAQIEELDGSVAAKRVKAAKS